MKNRNSYEKTPLMKLDSYVRYKSTENVWQAGRLALLFRRNTPRLKINEFDLPFLRWVWRSTSPFMLTSVLDFFKPTSTVTTFVCLHFDMLTFMTISCIWIDKNLVAVSTRMLATFNIASEIEFYNFISSPSLSLSFSLQLLLLLLLLCCWATCEAMFMLGKFEGKNSCSIWSLYDRPLILKPRRGVSEIEDGDEGDSTGWLNWVIQLGNSTGWFNWVIQLGDIQH